MAYLTCFDLAVGYAGKPVVEGINLSVGPGDLLCVIGENGAGKSTLVRTLLGLQAPVAGELKFGDGVSSGDVGYLPQQGETQRDFPASVWEIVLSGCLTHLGRRPFYGPAERALARKSLERVNAWDLRRRSFVNLSGGQQQRVLIARALCAASRLLVLDEPMTGLDPSASAELYGIIDLLREQDMGVISVSHDVSHALRHASHVLSLGRTTFYGTVEEWHQFRWHADQAASGECVECGAHVHTAPATSAAPGEHAHAHPAHDQKEHAHG